MKRYYLIFDIGFVIISVLFIGSAVVLIGHAILSLWESVFPAEPGDITLRFNSALNSISSLTVAAAALALGETIIEEEVIRVGHMSAPTRVRRFLSRFMTVIVVSLSVESLVAVLQFIHDAPERLSEAASVGLAAAALLAGWGIFVRFNRSVEEIEPEAIERTKRQEDQIEQEKNSG